MLHLNPWPIDEFLKLADALGMSPEKALARYRIFGGVPRPAITNPTRTESDLEAEVSAEQAGQLLNPSLLGMRGNFSHTLVHVRVSAVHVEKHTSMPTKAITPVLHSGCLPTSNSINSTTGFLAG